MVPKKIYLKIKIYVSTSKWDSLVVVMFVMSSLTTDRDVHELLIVGGVLVYVARPRSLSSGCGGQWSRARLSLMTWPYKSYYSIAFFLILHLIWLEVWPFLLFIPRTLRMSTIVPCARPLDRSIVWCISILRKYFSVVLMSLKIEFSRWFLWKYCQSALGPSARASPYLTPWWNCDTRTPANKYHQKVSALNRLTRDSS